MARAHRLAPAPVSSCAVPARAVPLQQLPCTSCLPPSPPTRTIPLQQLPCVSRSLPHPHSAPCRSRRAARALSPALVQQSSHPSSLPRPGLSRAVLAHSFDNAVRRFLPLASCAPGRAPPPSCAHPVPTGARGVAPTATLPVYRPPAAITLLGSTHSLVRHSPGPTLGPARTLTAVTHQWYPRLVTEYASAARDSGTTLACLGPARTRTAATAAPGSGPRTYWPRLTAHPGPAPAPDPIPVNRSELLLAVAPCTHLVPPGARHGSGSTPVSPSWFRFLRLHSSACAQPGPPTRPACPLSMPGADAQ